MKQFSKSNLSAKALALTEKYPSIFYEPNTMKEMSSYAEEVPENELVNLRFGLNAKRGSLASSRKFVSLPSK